MNMNDPDTALFVGVLIGFGYRCFLDPLIRWVIRRGRNI